MTTAAEASPPTPAALPVSTLWADKYKPRTIAQMCYPVCANKIKAWVEGFEPAGTGDPKKPRAALLSGPPGVGKTTTVYVVATELGRTVIEYNASDFRSRKSLKEKVSTITNNRAFSTSATSYTNVLLLMDEVDGCDIGGVGEVIEMIKVTKVPILCTCNDRWHQKLRSLINYVEDVRFSRPPCNIVANYLCDKVLAREGVTLSKPLLQDVIKQSGSDIRNMLTNLQLWCAKDRVVSQQQLAACAVQSKKDSDTGIFDAAEYFLLQGTSQGERHTIEDMQSCYYNNDLIDMFVQENYLHFNPSTTDPSRSWMGTVAAAAACISRADAAQRMMYLEQNWSVSRMHVLSSSIAPCVYTRGKYESFLPASQAFYDRQRPVKFPSWLGHNSTANKNKRLLRCLAMQASHPAKGISGAPEDVVMDYVPLGWELPLTQPLVAREKDGIAEVIAVMDQYRLLRDDWDFVMSVSHYKNMHRRSSLAALGGSIATAVKSAFTREFNKTHKTESFTKAALSHIATDTTNKAEDLDAVEEEENGKKGSELDSFIVKQKKKPAPKSAAAKKPPAKGSRKKASKEEDEDDAEEEGKSAVASEKRKRSPVPKAAKKKASPKKRRKTQGSDSSVSSSDSISVISDSD
ncbi:replication factor C subunit 1 [Strigomonas culicis]|uniref:Replication factor C subunit 1 n=1 Tax=Strigomonas culicis TaxID=28005 RepID=S9WFW9_9TRYP|nr:replication factor C subunit 1 [Strigomonas culicis]EPY34610.1 replication factor C subunit 1 [Strigomonas culicis]|eukprot:EPY29144.1 replication factor C subunit 1 [Strigomonas culicis]